MGGLPDRRLCNTRHYVPERMRALVDGPTASSIRTLREAHGTDGVRVVHVAPASNTDYQQSFHRPSQRALGDTVAEVWRRLLRSADRFVWVDSSRFLDPGITSAEYVDRYGRTAP